MSHCPSISTSQTHINNTRSPTSTLTASVRSLAAFVRRKHPQRSWRHKPNHRASQPPFFHLYSPVRLLQPIVSFFKQIGSKCLRCSRAPPERRKTDLEKYNSTSRTKDTNPIQLLGLRQRVQRPRRRTRTHDSTAHPQIFPAHHP